MLPDRECQVWPTRVVHPTHPGFPERTLRGRRGAGWRITMKLCEHLFDFESFFALKNKIGMYQEIQFSHPEFLEITAGVLALITDMEK